MTTDRTASCYATLIPKHSYTEDLGGGNWRCTACKRVIHVEVVPFETGAMSKEQRP